MQEKGTHPVLCANSSGCKLLTGQELSTLRFGSPGAQTRYQTLLSRLNAEGMLDEIGCSL